MICFIIVSRFGIEIGSDVIAIALREEDEERLSLTPGSNLIGVLLIVVENEQDDGIASLE